jgi:hypothetical protein
LRLAAGDGAGVSAGTGWQRIETAPRGERVLICRIHVDGEVDYMYVGKKTAGGNWEIMRSAKGGRWSVSPPPQYWQPLPEAPK